MNDPHEISDHDSAIRAALLERTSELRIPPGSAASARRRAHRRDHRTRIAVGAGSACVLAGAAVLLTSGDHSPRRLQPGGLSFPDGPSLPGDTTPHIVVGPTTGIETTTLQRELKRFDEGDDVRDLQVRLTELGFDPNGIDGQFGRGTEMAVWAFEGLVYGRGYEEQTGVVTAEMWQMMQRPIEFQAQRAEVSAGATHVEIYLPMHVLVVYTDGVARLITHISAGSGEAWCEVITQDTDDQGQPLPDPVLKDVCGVSKTPGGVFTFYRRYEGKRLGPLGGMTNPVYFNYGIAVHGADNVPKEPASHGAIRIPQWIAEYFPTLVANGDYVYVWGLDGKQPEENTKEEMLPVFNYRNPNSTLVTTAP